MWQTLTLDLDGGGGDSFAEIVVGTTHVYALVIRTHPSNVQGHVAEVVGAVDA